MGDQSFFHEEKVTGFLLIMGYIGAFLMIIGGIVLLPLLTLLFYPSESSEARYFILPGVLSILIGYLLFYSIRGKEKGRLQRNQDAIIVVLCWMFAIVICSMPFILSGKYTFTQAVFEMTSAWSTTGLSIVDVEQTSHLFLMHRSTVLFFGGIGLVLVMMSVLSDTYGMRLYAAEGHNDRLLPNLLRSARIIITIYLCYILSGMILYVIFGMSVFDALIHSIGALSTGGFSSHAESIGYYDNVPIEMVTITLMILGNINFLAHLYLVRGKFRNFFHYCEVRFSIIVLALITPLMGLLFVSALNVTIPEALRTALFQTVSALTTTGFQTVRSFATLPSSILLLLIVLQLIGGGMGSTAGGIKQYRVYALCKGIYWNMKSLLSGKNIMQSHKISKVNKKESIDSAELSQIGLYVILYLAIFVAGSFILCCYGYSLVDSMFEFSSALGTVGLSAGIMTYDAPALILWIGTIGMYIGRLEIYVVLLAIARTGKDIHHCFIQKKRVGFASFKGKRRV